MTSIRKLTDEEIRSRIGARRGWTFHNNQLTREFKFRDFAQALAFTDRVGALAEEEDHHPAILTEWGKVTVAWWTHKIRGLHRNDFVMAAKSDGLYG